MPLKEGYLLMFLLFVRGIYKSVNEAIKELFKVPGINIDLKDSDGKTIADFAGYIRNNDEIMKALRDLGKNRQTGTSAEPVATRTTSG